jgi:hypothetical protein
VNTNQKRILIAVIVLVAGMLLHPPFQRVTSNGAISNMGYGWIFEPPGGNATVNVSILLIQWVGVFVVGGLGFFLAKGSSAANSPGPKGVGGWLLLLVAGMLVLGPLLGAGRIAGNIFAAENQFPELKASTSWGTYTSMTWLIFLAVAAASVYGGWGLLRGKDWSAVSRAKWILWITGPAASLVLGVLVPKMALGEWGVDAKVVGGLIASVIATAIWTTYLSKSKRVRNTYGMTEVSVEPPGYAANRPQAAPSVPAIRQPDAASQQTVPAAHADLAPTTVSEFKPMQPVSVADSFEVDQDAVYVTVAAELETGNTDKGLWTRVYAGCDGDEQKTKVAYIKQRAEKLIAMERTRLEELERLRSQQAEQVERKKADRELAIQRLRDDARFEQILRRAEHHRDNPRMPIDEKELLLRLVGGNFKWLGFGGGCGATFLGEEMHFSSGKDFANWFLSELVPFLMSMQPSERDTKPLNEHKDATKTSAVHISLENTMPPP